MQIAGEVEGTEEEEESERFFIGFFFGRFHTCIFVHTKYRFLMYIRMDVSAPMAKNIPK